MILDFLLNLLLLCTQSALLLYLQGNAAESAIATTPKNSFKVSCTA
ncbi:MAG: hypothetical protein RMX68_025960 [Aulosira sp. ZfuVER01]|nr:hypothetical protein [Aulosira sp. DedVER01a]MDZ8053343.1 hypothetical protein [Aulosira sp. ZfuCHP01]